MRFKIFWSGEEIKTIGDAFLVNYSSSIDSINSAIAIQKSLDIYNSEYDDFSRMTSCIFDFIQ